MPKTEPIREIVQDEIDKLYLGYLKPEFEAIRKDMRHGFKVLSQGQKQLFQNQQDLKTYVDRRFDEAATERQYLKSQLNDLTTDTPSRKEFNDLKARVDHYHPLN